jgi:peptidyl-Lys metalloendopeptidase
VSQNVRGFKWLVGGIVGVSLLGACGAPMEGEDASQQLTEQAVGDIAVSLSVASGSLSATQDAVVTVTYTNLSSQPVQLLKWYVPGSGSVPAGLFEVTRDGEEVDFVGPHVKRVAPRPEDFITLAAGESLSRTTSLSDMYDLRQSGTYAIRFAAQTINQHNVVLTRTAALDSNVVSLFVEGRAGRQPELQAQGVSAQGLTSESNCSSTRASQISTAFASAQTYANETSSFLNGISSGATRYTTWFGTYSSANLTTARNHFTAIKNGARGLQLHGLGHLRLRVPGLALQDLRVRRLLERGQHGHGLARGHAGARDEPLQHRGEHGRPRLRPVLGQEPGQEQPQQGAG